MYWYLQIVDDNLLRDFINIYGERNHRHKECQHPLKNVERSSLSYLPRYSRDTHTSTWPTLDWTRMIRLASLSTFSAHGSSQRFDVFEASFPNKSSGRAESFEPDAGDEGLELTLFILFVTISFISIHIPKNTFRTTGHRRLLAKNIHHFRSLPWDTHDR